MNSWIKLITKRPVWVILAGLLLTIMAATWGLKVFSHLSSGGFDDPKSSSYRAAEIVSREFATRHTDLVVLFTASDQRVDAPATAAKIKTEVDKIAAADGVKSVVSVFTAPLPSFTSKDGHQTFALVTLDGKPAVQQKTFERLETLVPGSDGLKVQYGGPVAVNAQITDQTKHDLDKAELLSFPILAVLLLIIFRSVIAALVPLILGGLSIIVAFLLVRVLTMFTDVSIYAINIITLMGLGLAIDYSLFTVSRFREELAAGQDVDGALSTTMRTAGRTVLFSGLTVILSLLGLLVFRENFLRSMGLGGAAAVAATVILSATVLPAVLKLLGRHINSLALPGLAHTLDRPATTGIWYRYSHFVMRYPLVMLGVAVELLVILGLPFLGAHFTTPDATTIPTTLSSRQVNEALTHNFKGAGQSPIIIVARTPVVATDPSLRAAVKDYSTAIGKITGVSSVTTAGASGNYLEITATLEDEPQSDAARQTVKDVRAINPPSGWKIETNGETAALVDLLASLREKIPWAGLIIVVATSTLLFLMLGSVVIPIKAIILNVLSLSAAFGLLVWVFQDGHLTKTLGLTSNGSLDATQPILIFAIAFGLAMDYELFLLSRVKEEYDRTGDNTQAIAVGVQRTAGIITSAALMLVVVIGLFATGKISIIQQVGVGLGAAVAIDATIVRMILVPAAMRLIGKYNWWAPKPLAAFARRLGLRE